MSQPLHTHDGPLALHFRYPHIYDESSVVARVSDVAIASRAVANAATLHTWTRESLQQLIPHEKAIFGLGAFALDRYRIDRHERMNFDDDYFADYLPRSPYRRSPLVDNWITTRRAQSVTIETIDRDRFGHWLHNATRHRIGNGMIAAYEHGASGVFSFMKLFNVRISLGEAIERSDAIAPLFKDIWARIVDSEIGPPPSSRPPTRLTSAQLEVLALLRQHKSNPEIAAALKKSPATIKTQIEDMLRRTGAPNRKILAATDWS